jgi:hypothetical protein
MRSGRPPGKRFVSPTAVGQRLNATLGANEEVLETTECSQVDVCVALSNTNRQDPCFYPLFAIVVTVSGHREAGAFLCWAFPSSQGFVRLLRASKSVAHNRRQ